MKIDFSKWLDTGYRVFPLNGKHPHWPSLPIGADGKPTWLPYVEREPTEEEIKKWENSNGYTGIAVLTGEVSGIIALDWDCTLFDYPEIIKYIPESPVIRVGKSPKWMRFYKYNKDLPSRKLLLKTTDTTKDGIELLTDGRYFVADGLHPDTKKPYLYVGDHLLDIDKDTLPEFPLSVWRTIEQLSEKYRGTISTNTAGRHDELIQYTGKLISAGVSREQAIPLIKKLDSTYKESYFDTHKNSAEQMFDSILKTHKRNLRKKILKQVQPSEVVTETTEHSVTVHHVDGEETPSLPPKVLGELLALGVSLNTQGKPIPNESNIFKVITSWTSIHKDFIWYDEFQRNFFTKGLFGDKPQTQWDSKTHLIELLILIQERLKFHNLSKDKLKDAVLAYGLHNKKNELHDYIKGLTWDGTPRINSFLTDCFGADDSQYTRYASKNLWISMIARAMNAGCKVDTMLILEGDQGRGKSTGLKEMVGERWFAEISQDPKDKDFYVALQGKLLVEISELEAFNKAETTTIKRMLSCSTDRFRVPYGDTAQDFPRQNIFVGTTNETGYLKDSTGNRRFWPVKTGEIDLHSIRFFRDMFFAEAHTRWLKGEDWHKMPLKETLHAQESRTQDDAWQDAIDEYLIRNPKTTIKDVAIHALSMKIQDVNRITENRIAACLRKSGLVLKFEWDAISKKTIRRWAKAYAELEQE